MRTPLVPLVIALTLPAALAVAQAPLPRVALCAAASSSITACQWTTVQSALVATNRFAAVDIIDVTAAGGGTPALATLLQYDALMCWTNTTPANNVTWGNVLADYVDAGGGVVVTVFANSSLTAGRNIDGRWQMGYEVILDRTGSTSSAGGSLGTVAVPTHPVMAGVVLFAAGSLGSRPVGTALEVGSTLIASWNTGHVLVAEGANPRRVDLGFYPPTATCTQSGWVFGGDLLMANALVHVANGGRFVPYGAGCAGSNGVPTLAPAPGSRPAIGTSFVLELGNLPVGVGLVGTGLSDSMSGPWTLPLDLTMFGLTGCMLYADPLVTVFVVGAGTTATSTLAIPNDPTLQGLRLFTQGFSLDPPANAAGLTVSNAGRLQIGV